MASIQQRGERSWLLVLETGSDANEKRKKRTKTIRVEDERVLKSPKKLREHLNDELLRFKIEVEAGTYVKPAKMTFEQFVRNEWIPKYSRKNMSPLTYRNYIDHLDRTLLLVFGHYALHDIKTMHIVTFLDDLDKSNLSGSTKLYIFKVLKSVFNQAVRWRVLATNPVDGAERPKVESKKARYYDEVEAQKVIAALQYELPKWRMFFLSAMLGGFRRGELVALEWPDVDIEAATICIRKSISITQNGKAHEKAPKTEGSERLVDMPRWLMDELRRFRFLWLEERLQMGEEWRGGDRQYVFHGGDGQPLFHNTPSLTWRRFIARHNLPKTRLHDLRHTAATLLIESETDLKAVQERLGHTKYSTTADLYAHVTKKIRQETASKLDKFDPYRSLLSTNRQQ
ncbi:hypothetical protein SD70_29370 [Gordoniibacillus kamchatkensis]|uniref:Site-specific integrase n=1 Tax=Gordoniibacillus kamchatkensis TaxID=1590651 RepID=A0ABR5AAC3_9BACL|nr:site-specific integrase [Paenibacillus sp. VKM B-2647]KIL38009.1 hypothetical protein SD70_29370 [Paenibacillus sp. VKM B-2647]